LKVLVPLTLVLGLSLSLVLAWQQETVAKTTDQIRFDSLTDRVQSDINNRVSQLRYGLSGARSLWPASEHVSRRDFEAMVNARVFYREFPSALGLGFIRRVRRADVDFFLKETRADRAPNFTLKTSGDAPDLFVIEFIEPLGSNRDSEGYDVGQERYRRAAAERAMLSGQATMTEPISLVQARDAGPGFLIFMPVYKAGRLWMTPEEREANLIGWTFIPCLASRLFESLAGDSGGELRVRIIADKADGDKTLIVQSDNWDEAKREDGWLASETRMSVAGVKWVVECLPTDRFQAASRSGVYGALLAGPLITVMLSMLMSGLVGVTGRSREMADMMTADLRLAVQETERMALVAKHTTNGVLMTDALRRITWVNEGFTRLTGYSFADVVGESPGFILHCRETDPEIVAKMRNALNLGVSFQAEILNRHKSGQLFWNHLDMAPLRNASGELTGFVCIELDITERKIAQTRIAEQMERTDLALSSGELGLWDWNVSTGETLFDERWAAMLGERSEDLRPNVEEWVKRCHPDDLAAAQAALQEHFSGGSPIFRCLHRMRYKDGTWRWIMDCGKVVKRGTHGEPLRMVGTHRDVTAQHEARIEQERRSAALLNTSRLARVGSWELDLVNQTLTWSDQVKAIHEVPRDYVPTLEEAISFYPGDAAETIGQLVRRAIKEGKSFDVELPLVTAKGNRLWVRGMGEAYRPEGKTLLVRGAFQDITESYLQRDALARAKEAAEAATRVKADFLANMSHEIRTPMNAVVGMTELLQGTALTQEQVEYVHTIRSGGETLLSLINDILDFSKIEAGHLELERVPVVLRDCVESSVDLNWGAALKKKLELFIEIDPGVPEVFLGDPTRMRQVLTNLVNNAVKFTPHGEVVVSVGRRSSGAIWFAVKDTGIGIPKHKLDRLFRTFSQVDASTTRHYGGTGLGLAICGRLVTSMGGKIWVESAPDLGSTFQFEIPFEETPETQFPVVAERAALLAGRRVLVVERSATGRRILQGMLTDWGLTPQMVANGEEALSLAGEAPGFDVAIIDARVAGATGKRLVEALRPGQEGGRRVPVVLLGTAITDRDILADDAEAQLVMKPVKARHLRDVLSRLFVAMTIEQRRAGAVRSQAAQIEVPLATEYPLRILLAEDIEVNQRVAALLFQRMGYELEIVSNGQEVLDKVARERFDLIFLDVQMPVMDGLDCARRLCATYEAGERPWMIAMTANALDGDREICLRAGMDDYMSKPVSVQAITGCILRGAQARRVTQG
jgi:PAS domain S-box-containing protein